MSAPHFTGKNCLLKIFIGGSEVGDALDVKNWSIKPNVTAINDGVCGENRDRLDKETNFFEGKFSCFNVNLSKLEALLKDQKAEDDGSTPVSKEFALVIKPKDGSKGGYTGTEAVIDDWEFAVGGRTDRAMLEIPVRMRYFEKVAAL